MYASFARRGALAVAFALAASSTTASAVTTPKTAAPSALTALPTLSEQQRYRAELGLPASAQVVTDLNKRWSGGSLPDAGTEGAVFTADEQHELDAREGAAREIGAAARSYFTGDLETAFGGMFIDHTAGKTAVLVTRDAAKHLAALRQRIDNDDRLSVRTSKFSLAQLDDIVAVLTANANRLAAADAAFTTAGVTENENVVDVALLADSPTARQQVLNLLNPADRAAVRFGPGAPVETIGVDGLNAPPLKGGQRISRSTADPTLISICTTAFNGYKRVRTDAAIYVTNYYLVTAGHCASTSADMQRAWVQGRLGGATYPIGVPDRNDIFSVGGVDAMRFPISSADQSQKVAISATQDRHIYSRQSSSADLVNERVCMSGATTGGELCGTLLAKNVTVNQAGRTFTNIRVVSFDAKGGDSGGSVLYNSEARGIVQARGPYPYSTSPSRMFYGHIQPALSRLLLDNVVGVG